ncbi:MAG: hypothetical protein DI589_16370 [Shinella sp.]|nr:MAG: hypothetical protein DI589_16370 [Shinella sp.]
MNMGLRGHFCINTRQANSKLLGLKRLVLIGLYRSRGAPRSSVSSPTTMPPAYVKAYLKRNKTDAADAEDRVRWSGLA